MSFKGLQIHALTVWRTWVGPGRLHSSRKILDMRDVVFGQNDLQESINIKPTIGRAFDTPVVEIKAVYVNCSSRVIPHIPRARKSKGPKVASGALRLTDETISVVRTII